MIVSGGVFFKSRDLSYVRIKVTHRQYNKPLLPKSDGFLGYQVEQIFIPLYVGIIVAVLTCNIDMEECISFLLVVVVNKKPLALLHDVLLAWRYKWVPLMCCEVVPVNHTEATSTFVWSASFGSPDFVTINGWLNVGFVCPSKCFTYPQHLYYEITFGSFILI